MKKLKDRTGSLRSVNPPDAYRKTQRDREKKKNKLERRHNREQSLLKRTPRIIKEELESLRELQKSHVLRESQKKRLIKLEQLWAVVMQSVLAEKRARSAELLHLDESYNSFNSAAAIAAIPDSGAASSSVEEAAALTGRDQRNILNSGGKGDKRQGSLIKADRFDDEYLLLKEAEQHRYYNPEMCNAGIFRHPDGSIRGYPPARRPGLFEQRMKFIESLKEERRRRSGCVEESWKKRRAGNEAKAESDESDSDSDSSEEDSSNSTAVGARATEHQGLATVNEEDEAENEEEDLLANIPLPDDLPPTPAAEPPVSATTANAEPPLQPLQTGNAVIFPPPLLPPFPPPPLPLGIPPLPAFPSLPVAATAPAAATSAQQASASTSTSIAAAAPTTTPAGAAPTTTAAAYCMPPPPPFIFPFPPPLHAAAAEAGSAASDAPHLPVTAKMGQFASVDALYKTSPAGFPTFLPDNTEQQQRLVHSTVQHSTLRSSSQVVDRNTSAAPTEQQTQRPQAVVGVSPVNAPNSSLMRAKQTPKAATMTTTPPLPKVSGVSRAATAFVPTQLRSTNRVAKAATPVPPRRSIVLQHSGAAAFGFSGARIAQQQRSGAVVGGQREAVETPGGSGQLFRGDTAALGKAAKAGASAALQTSGSAVGGAAKDLDALFDDFLKEVGEG